RNIIGEVISRIERKGLKIVAMELRTLDEETAKAHYEEHVEKPFFSSLVEFITGGPLVAMLVEGNRAIEPFGSLAGATDPVLAAQLTRPSAAPTVSTSRPPSSTVRPPPTRPSARSSSCSLPWPEPGRTVLPPATARRRPTAARRSIPPGRGAFSTSVRQTGAFV